MNQNSRHRAATILADPRWAQIGTRDGRADGQFVYGVRSTGVFCRPSCGARRPRPENVTFFASPAEASAAGFRPCRRCRPDQPEPGPDQAALITRLCRTIEAADTPPTLYALAQLARLSPTRLQRLFKTATGLSPRAYAEAWRRHRLCEKLAADVTTTQAIFDAGYNTSSHVYENATALLGMSPRRYRSGGAGEQIRFALGQCSLGAILVAASERGICAISLGDDPEALLRELQERFPHAGLQGGDAAFEALVAQVVGFVESPRQGLDLPLDIRGTAFQQRVWQALQRIPPGSTATYSDIARAMGTPQACRAVARACAGNVLAVAIPCHRVVRLDGMLSGYRWGVERKRALLERERQG